MTEQFSNQHFITIDSNNNITRGFSDAFEQPQPTDILINEQGGYQFRLHPGGMENPPLFDDWGVSLYRWDGTQVIERTPQEIEADRQAIENSPANQIANLNVKINQGLPEVVAHLYDIITAIVKSADSETYTAFSAKLEAIMPKLTQDEFELVQIDGEPNSTGKSQW